MDQIIMMAMQTAQNYAEKCATCTLTEFEVIAYENICNIIAAYTRMHTVAMDINYFDIEKQHVIQKAQYDIWVMKKEKAEKSGKLDRWLQSELKKVKNES